MKKALIFQGGWPGHEPEAVANLFAKELAKHNFSVEVSGSLDCLDDPNALQQLDLIVPCWTMGSLSEERFKNLESAISSGVGLGGFHGGMGDAFRENLPYQWLVGGQFLDHPSPRSYQVRKTGIPHPIMSGLPDSFEYTSEIYYMMCDPANCVLAETDYTFHDRTFKVPVVWVKPWNKGRVFYSALGHQEKEFLDYPKIRDMTTRGLLWAAGTELESATLVK